MRSAPISPKFRHCHYLLLDFGWIPFSTLRPSLLASFLRSLAPSIFSITFAQVLSFECLELQSAFVTDDLSM